MDKFIFKYALIDISDSTTVSLAVDLLGYQLVGVVVPTGWEAANVTFQVSVDGVFHLVTGLTLTTPTANQLTPLNTGAAAPYIVPFIVGEQVKVVSSAPQSADRNVKLLLIKLP